jgi:hypothetical protein
MDMDGKHHSPILLGKPFLATTDAIMDAKEGNLKFQFLHNNCIEHFPRKKEGPKNCPHGMCTS